MKDDLGTKAGPFLWGVATSAYQIEGAASEDGRGESIWDRFCREAGNVADGTSGAVACDHYRRWPADLDLIASLGVDAYRFSISWPRILPEGRGRVESRGLDFYERLVDGMLERGIRPFATLYHWDLPQALEDEGGWPARSTSEAFAEYADVVTARLGDRVEAWATLNEPWCSAYLGYGNGEHAPGRRDREASLQAAHNLLLAHGLALPLMRANAPRAAHGVVLNLTPAYPASDLDEDREAAWRFDGFFNRRFLDPLLLGGYPEDVWRAFGDSAPEVAPGDLEAIAVPLDFLGVNYYSRARVSHGRGEWPSVRHTPPDGPVTEMGWEVYPRGLTDLLVRLRHDYPAVPPLFVTENGAAYADEWSDGVVRDRERIAYLQGHIEAVVRAVEAGVDVRGYFAWSLLDNFEWAHGYRKRFGLVHVDYASQRRTPKESAYWYRQEVARRKATSGVAR